MAFRAGIPKEIFTHVRRVASNPAAAFRNRSKAGGIWQLSSAGQALRYDESGTVREIANLDGTQTLSGKTLVSPTITGNGLGGAVVAKQVTFAETAAGVSHVGTVAIPAGAKLVDIIVDAGVLWGAAAAVMKIGDTADDDGYFIGVDLKATDLLVGEQLRISNSALWGGKEGAYLVAASGRRGPVANNFGGQYVAGSNILITITVTTPTPTTGRTYVTVLYSVGEVVAPVVT